MNRKYKSVHGSCTNSHWLLKYKLGFITKLINYFQKG